MIWTCEQIESRLSDYLDGMLEPSARAEFATHVEQCPGCRGLVARVSGVVKQLHEMEMVEEPALLATQILAKTVGPSKKKNRWRGFEWLGPLSNPRLAYGSLSVAIMLGVVIPTLGTNWRKAKFEALNPVNLYRAADREAHLVYARGARFVADLRVVYEIQSRLRPETEPQATPEREPQPKNSNPPGSSNGPSKSPRGLNRANQIPAETGLLADVLPNVYGRRAP